MGQDVTPALFSVLYSTLGLCWLMKFKLRYKMSVNQVALGMITLRSAKSAKNRDKLLLLDHTSLEWKHYH